MADGAVTGQKTDPSSVQSRIAGSCAVDNAIRAIGLDGTVSCEPVAGGVGDITGVTVGAGLSGGGVSGDVSVSVATGGITSALVADGTLSGADVADGSLLGGDVSDGTLTGADISDAAIASTDVTDASLASIDIADGSLTSSDIADHTISSVDIANSSIASVAIADGNVVSTDIGDGSVALVDRGADSVNSAKIADASVTSADLGDGTVASADVDSEALWLVGGNNFATSSAKVFGSSNQAPLEFRAGEAHVQRFEPNSTSPNVIAGDPSNSVTAGVRGATSAGGGVISDLTFALGAPTA